MQQNRDPYRLISIREVTQVMKTETNTRIRITALGLIICMTAVLFAGCLSAKEVREQKMWIKKLGMVFEDDKFTYSGAATSGEFGKIPTIAYCTSENYPGETIIVRKEKDGELVTNYNYIRYKEDAEDYIEDYFDGIFECDDYDTYFNPHGSYTPIKDMSCKEYLKKYLELNRVQVALYKEDGIFPSEEEMTQKFIDIVEDRDEPCNITVYCCTEEVDRELLHKESMYYYTLTMNKPDKINSISYTGDGGNDRHVILENYDV